MFRNALNNLIAWKTDKKRKPLIIHGARQVGKTWLMKKFGRTCFEKTAYINFDNNASMAQVFSGDFDIPRIIAAFQIEAGVRIEPNNTLIVCDEIQEVQG